MSYTDLFRFISHRPPVAIPPDRSDDIIEILAGDEPGEFASSLLEAAASGEAVSETIAIAKDFLASAEFTSGLAVELPELLPLAGRVAQTRGELDPEEARELLSSLHIGLADLKVLLRRMQDSFAASLLVPDRPRQERRQLERDIRFVGLLLILLGDDVQNPQAAKKAYRGTLALPSTIFPLRHQDPGLERAKELHESRKQFITEKQAQVKELAARIEANNAAIAELENNYNQDKRLQAQRVNEAPDPVEKVVKPNTRRGLIQRSLEFIGLAEGARSAMTIKSFSARGAAPVLPVDLAKQLSEASLGRLRQLGHDPEFLSVSHAVTALEADNAGAADGLFRGGVSGDVVALGGLHVDLGDLVVGPDVLAPPDWPRRTPGLCLPPEAEAPQPDESSVPQTVGAFLSLGIGDLLVVRQRLIRYELGEIAHVENVMAKENRQREHRSLSSIETIELTETEVIEENERDLETAERFELQTESERTISENASRHAGVTVTASYGFSVEVAADAGFASETAKSSADRVASSHAREITERAVQKTQERTLRRRTVTTFNEIEETNQHGFDNQEDSHVVGVYRWLDKIYEAQVFDYGKRELINILVPEPAAFFRHASATKPKEGSTLKKPEPPGYCSADRSRFTALEPKDISETSYKLWAARYNVADVMPPPPRFRVIAAAFHETWSNDDPKATAQSSEKLKVPQGYRASRTWLASTHAHFARDEEDDQTPQLKVFVGRQEIRGSAATQLHNEDDIVPISIAGVLLLAYVVNIEVECVRSKEAYEEWQLDVFTKVMRAYATERAAYDAALREADESYEDLLIRGRNPSQNRATERTELKRAAISQMTGQHFDLFNAMRYGVPPQGYPQADLSEAEAEGAYIQFIEQAFEWENMQYLFYPYFWGRKEKWPLVSQLDDDDPLFREFLRAGSARVNIPVRPGFETAVNTFLSTGLLPWNSDSDEAVVTQEELFLSIAEEIKAQQGAIHTKTGGSIAVDTGSPDVQGTDTEFNADDERRDITIAGEIYRVEAVSSATSLTLASPYRGPANSRAGYVIGAKAVGEPWTVRLPTSLVMLQPDASLPEF